MELVAVGDSVVPDQAVGAIVLQVGMYALGPYAVMGAIERLAHNRQLLDADIFQLASHHLAAIHFDFAGTLARLGAVGRFATIVRMPDHDAFLRMIADQPDDDGPRLVYADWLEERGDTARAEFIRVQIEAERWPEYSPRRMELERAPPSWKANTAKSGRGRWRT